MTARVASLRARLLVLILVPLVAISVLAGYWRYSVARETAEDLFDRTLLASAMAISRDVAVSGGDALSPATRDLMRSAAGGEVFYHVNGPDGVFVTGYATPPPPPPKLARVADAPTFFKARYRGQPVRVVRLREFGTMDGISGYSTVTVWQTRNTRDTFARELGLRAAAVIVTLIATVAAVVWFGVNLGLRPLTDLQEAISRRSSHELGGIRRPVPREVQGVVDTLNDLFSQVAQAMKSRDGFISDAAHQLRNPIAGVLSMAEAVRDAPDEAERRNRAADLVEAAQHASRLATQLLSYERLKAEGAGPAERTDLARLARGVADRNVQRILARGLDLDFEAPEEPVWVEGNETLLAEALENLIDNALVHGGPDLHTIHVEVAAAAGGPILRVRDDGRGLEPKDEPVAFARFGQVRPGQGSGLGLAIVREIAATHRARLAIEPSPVGCTIAMHFAPSRIHPE